MRFLIAALLLALAPAAWAQTDPACTGQAACLSNLSAADVFAIADRYVAAGDLDAAETLLEGLTRDLDAEMRAEARFRLALVRERRGDLAGAAEAYRALLDEKPEAQRPRLELARVLALQGDESGARRELRKAGTTGLPDDVARAVDQFALALRSSRPVGGSIEIALAPDSNINRATDRDTVDTVIAPLELDDDAKARSGVGLAISAQGFWRADAGKDVTILTRLSGRGDLYKENRFNDVIASLASGPEFRAGGGRWRPAAIYSRRWFGGDLYSQSYGASLNWLKPLTSVSQVEAEATFLKSDYSINPAQDGTILDANAAFDHAFSTRFSTRIGLRANRVDAAEPSLASTSGSIELIASRQVGKQIVFAQASGSRLWSDERMALFPEIRRDWRYDLTAGLLLREFSYQGLSPVIRISRSVNASTVGIYDFKKTRVEFALSREF